MPRQARGAQCLVGERDCLVVPMLRRYANVVELTAVNPPISCRLTDIARSPWVVDVNFMRSLNS